MPAAKQTNSYFASVMFLRKRSVRFRPKADITAPENVVVCAEGCKGHQDSQATDTIREHGWLWKSGKAGERQSFSPSPLT